MTDHIDAAIDWLKAGETGREIEVWCWNALGAYKVMQDEWRPNPNKDEWCWRINGDDILVSPKMFPISTSFDACFALMERVLPGWVWSLFTSGDRSQYIAVVSQNGAPVFKGIAPTHVAALLIAILTAFKAESEAL